MKKHAEDEVKHRTIQEMAIIKSIKHENVIGIYDSFETQKHICFVMALCSGGDLYSYIKKRHRINEVTAKYFFRQILLGIESIHKAGVIHRDIKLENIMLDATGTIKIGDFGISRRINPNKKYTEQAGTPAYMAPEIVKQGYSGFQSDMWSAGVCLFAMLVGSVPFKASTISALNNLIVNAKYDFEFQAGSMKRITAAGKQIKDMFSKDVVNLIGQLLTLDPERRLTAKQALKHTWLKDAPNYMDVFSDKEKGVIYSDYIRLNPSKRDRINEEEVLFTEYNLETELDEPEDQKNIMEKSLILAPYCSLINLDDTQEPEPDLAPKSMLKFGKKVREINRKYEQNNNSDLDNGVINDAILEQDNEINEFLRSNSIGSIDSLEEEFNICSDHSCDESYIGVIQNNSALMEERVDVEVLKQISELSGCS